MKEQKVKVKQEVVNRIHKEKWYQGFMKYTDTDNWSASGYPSKDKENVERNFSWLDDPTRNSTTSQAQVMIVSYEIETVILKEDGRTEQK